MYLGHFAFGLAAKPLNQKISLGILLLSTQIIDILYAVFVFVGVNNPGELNPWDHGLVMAFVWSATAFLVYCLFSRDFRSGIVIAVLVFSHWVCDFLAWDHVLPLAFHGSPLVGLGLYNSVPIMFALDFGLFGGAMLYYLLKTKAVDRKGKLGPFLLIIYLIALIPVALLPGKLIALMVPAMIMVVPFGFWIDRHRLIIPSKSKNNHSENNFR